MLSFNLSKNVIDKLSKLLSDMSVLEGEILNADSAELEFIKRQVFISNIGASTRIENALLSDTEIDWLDTVLTASSAVASSTESSYQENKKNIRAKLSSERERSVEEVIGCRAMMQIILDSYETMLPLTESTLRGLHKELLSYYGDAERYRGKYKLQANSVVRFEDGKKIPVLTTSAPGLETDIAMADLVEWYHAHIDTETWTLAIATEFVFRFLAIHPFQDGNGRLGRGLFNLSLLHSPNSATSSVIPFLSIDRNIEKQRERYYLALRRSSDGKFLADPSEYEYESLTLFFIDIVNDSIKDFQYYRNKFAKLSKLTSSEEKILRCFKERPETKLQAKEIIAIVNLPRATLNDALLSLVKLGFLQRIGRGPATKYQLVF